MVRIKNPTAVQNKKRMSVRIPLGMIDRIEVNIHLSGYNKKQRFFWFEDVINELFMTPDYHWEDGWKAEHDEAVARKRKELSA